MCPINEFVLQDWEIWRQYTTYFLEPPSSSDEIATSLVESGTVMCARTVGGTLVWEEEGQTETEETSIQVQPDGRYSWKLRTDRKLGAFIVECLHQSAWFQASESKVLVAPDQFPASYVRGFAGECRFEGNGRLFSIYPVIKMYTTGVVQVSLRLMSPDRDVPLSEFIREYRNANTLRQRMGTRKARESGDEQRCRRQGTVSSSECLEAEESERSHRDIHTCKHGICEGR